MEEWRKGDEGEVGGVKEGEEGERRVVKLYKLGVVDSTAVQC